MICDSSSPEVFRAFHETGARQIWYPVILLLKWRQDQQLPSLWDRWWNVWFGPRLMSPWQPGNIFIQDNIVVMLFLLHPPTPPLFVTTACMCVCVLAVCSRLHVFRCHVCCSFWCVCKAALWPNRPVEERRVTGCYREPDPPRAERAAMLSEGIWSRSAVEGLEVDRGIQPHTMRSDGRAGTHFFLCVYKIRNFNFHYWSKSYIKNDLLLRDDVDNEEEDKKLIVRRWCSCRRLAAWRLQV